MPAAPRPASRLSRSWPLTIRPPPVEVPGMPARAPVKPFAGSAPPGPRRAAKTVMVVRGWTGSLPTPDPRGSAMTATTAVFGHDAVEFDDSRRLFLLLAELPPEDPRRGPVRDRLVELPLPLVRALAARYRHRGEPYDD